MGAAAQVLHGPEGSGLPAVGRSGSGHVADLCSAGAQPCRDTAAPGHGAGGSARHGGIEPAGLPDGAGYRHAVDAAPATGGVHPSLPEGPGRQGGPAFLHHHRCRARSGGRAQGPGAGADQSAGHLLRHTGGAAVRPAISAADASTDPGFSPAQWALSGRAGCAPARGCAEAPAVTLHGRHRLPQGPGRSVPTAAAGAGKVAGQAGGGEPEAAAPGRVGAPASDRRDHGLAGAPAGLFARDGQHVAAADPSGRPGALRGARLSGAADERAASGDSGDGHVHRRGMHRRHRQFPETRRPARPADAECQHQGHGPGLPQLAPG